MMKKEKNPLLNWKKCILLAGAAATAIAFSKHFLEEERIVPADEVSRTLTAPCCQVRILLPDSDFIERNHEAGPGLTLGDGLLIESMVQHPGSENYRLNPIREAFFTSALERMNELPDTFSRLDFIAGASDRSLLRAGGAQDFYLSIRRRIGHDAADLYLRRLVESTILLDGLQRRAESPFASVVVHEATHSAHLRYSELNNLPQLENRDAEFLGYLSPVAYHDPWGGLSFLWLNASRTYVNEPFAGYGISPIVEGQQGSLCAEIWAQLITRLGVSVNIQVLELTGNEIMQAARALLDEKSERLFGRPFAEVVPIRDLEKLSRQAQAIN